MSYRKADMLEETETGYRYQYDPEYLSQKNTEPVSEFKLDQLNELAKKYTLNVLPLQ